MSVKRTIKRFSAVTVRSGSKLRQLVLIVPPTCDVVLVREKGRRTAYELSIITAYRVAVLEQARRARLERKAKRKMG